MCRQSSWYLFLYFNGLFLNLGLEQSKEFLIERDKVPLILHNPEGFLFYGEFAICVFLVVLCCVSCCCIRREHKRNKKRAKMDYPYLDVSTNFLYN